MAAAVLGLAAAGCSQTVPHPVVAAPVAAAPALLPVHEPAAAAAVEKPRAVPPASAVTTVQPPLPVVELARPRGLRRADFAKTSPSAEARHVADWAVDSGDHGTLPFIVVDKVQATVHVFGADGRLRASSPVLLGLARGDHSVPGIGEKDLSDIPPEERTTPAGRFLAEMGENARGEDILWVDYDTAVSMHRVRPTVKAERRLQRLASPTPADNRISYGCINVPVAFYEKVVKPLFKPANGVVYVLPETRPARALFGSYDVAALQRR